MPDEDPYMGVKAGNGGPPFWYGLVSIVAAIIAGTYFWNPSGQERGLVHIPPQMWIVVVVLAFGGIVAKAVHAKVFGDV